MKTVELQRMGGNGKTTPGALYVDGKFICFTVENTAKLYPEGDYVFALGSTGRTMPEGFRGMAYEVKDVPERTQLKFHVANYWYQLEGCTAPNSNLYHKDGEITGGGSNAATFDFMEAMKDGGELVKEATLVVRRA